MELDLALPAEVHLAVVGGDDERGRLRQRVEQPADEVVDEDQLLAEVLVVEAELVRDRVDPRVVRVDEPLAAVDEAPGVLDQGRHRAPADEAHAPQVGLGEAGRRELRLGDHRHRPARERLVPLHRERIGRVAAVGLAATCRTLRTPPSIRMRKPDDPVLRRRQPGRHRRQRGRRGRGDDRRDRAALHRPQAGQVPARCVSSAFQPRPSSTSSTTAVAPVSAAGSHDALSGAG